MKKNKTKTTVAQEIIIAVNDLTRQGKEVFSEWDITVATWERDKNRFGMRGYEDQYPDHKRVMMEIMSKKKSESPIRRGFFEKIRPNYYSQTVLGKSEAERLSNFGISTTGNVRAPGTIFNAIEPYVNHRSFKSWLENPEEPRTWLGASSFLKISRNTPNELNDKIRIVETAIKHVFEWYDESGKDSLTRGLHAGGRPIHREQVSRLKEFVTMLEERFQIQMDAIRKKED